MARVCRGLLDFTAVPQSRHDCVHEVNLGTTDYAACAWVNDCAATRAKITATMSSCCLRFSGVFKTSRACCSHVVRPKQFFRSLENNRTRNELIHICSQTFGILSDRISTQHLPQMLRPSQTRTKFIVELASFASPHPAHSVKANETSRRRKMI